MNSIRPIFGLRLHGSDWPSGTTSPGCWRGQRVCARGGVVAASPVAEAERVQRGEHLRRVADTPGKVGCPEAHR
jgi:hypothetical protein